MGRTSATKRDTKPAEVGAGTAALHSKTASALVWFAMLAGLAYLGPGAFGLEAGERDEPLSAGALLRSLVAMPGDAHAAPLPAALAAGAAPSHEPARPSRSGAAAAPALESQPIDAEPNGPLAAFYAALARTEAGGADAVTRVVHYGDSMLTGDGISEAARSLLQARFGDAGHGFVLPGRPWPWYAHAGIRQWESRGWDIYRITSNPLLDGCMGLGGVAFRSIQPGARFYVEPVDGERVSRFELAYLAGPRGGRLQVELDDRAVGEVDTRADRLESRYYSVPVSEGQHRLVVTNLGGGQVRVFGVSVERGGPGVRWDALGVNGLHASNFARVDASHLADQIRHRAPHLIVVMLGTNESQNRFLDLDQHARDYAALLERLGAGAPEASCLVMSPPDRATRVGSGRAASLPVIPRIVERQREVARQRGCAFFDTFAAMGGEGSAARWRDERPVLMGGDMTHPTGAGSEVIGRSLVESLLEGYRRERAAAAGPSAAPSAR